jgi:23S rRNA (uridine2552-2'-O)-methyltransferase
MNWWIDRQKNDKFVQQRKHEQLRSRAAFKLRELIDKYKLKGATGPFLELGAAPGGWTEILVQTYPNDLIIACDLLSMKPVVGATVLQGDFTDPAFLENLKNQLNGKNAGGIFSDMAPNFSGQPLVEQSKMMHLTELMIAFSRKHLKPQGFVVQKLFHGSEFNNIIQLWKQELSQVSLFKPNSSRTESSEVYLYARLKK